MDRKKIILVVGFILSVIVFASLLYFFFFRDLLGNEGVSPDQTNINGVLPPIVNGNISIDDNTNEPGSLPGFPSGLIDLDAPTEVARGGLTIVKDYDLDSVDELVSDSKGAFFYNRETGFFFELVNGETNLLSDTQFFNVSDVEWANSRDKAILEYPDGSNVLFDFETEKQVTLPKEMTDFSFNPTGTQIAAEWYGDNRDENWLMIGDGKGQDFTLVEPIGDRGHNVDVDISPDNQVVALYRKASGSDTQVVLPIGQHGENYKQFEVDGLNFESKWSPTGNDLLYSASGSGADYSPTLFLTSGSDSQLGSSHVSLQLNTWSHKCVFNGDATSIYCAEPLELPRGAGLYPEIAEGLPDAFYRIDLNTGRKIPLAFPVGDQVSYSAKSVYLSPDESELFFIDATSDNLHSIRLR